MTPLDPPHDRGIEGPFRNDLPAEDRDSRWYPGAGIYRHTWLVKTNPVHVVNEGVTITTPKISAEAGEVKIVVQIMNGSDEPILPVIETSVHELNPDNAVGRLVPQPAVTTGKLAASIPSGQTGDETTTLRVPGPKLWDIATPNRYLARTMVLDFKTREILDTHDTTIGPK